MLFLLKHKLSLFLVCKQHMKPAWCYTVWSNSVCVTPRWQLCVSVNHCRIMLSRRKVATCSISHWGVWEVSEHTTHSHDNDSETLWDCRQEQKKNKRFVCPVIIDSFWILQVIFEHFSPAKWTQSHIKVLQ